ncbi:hypothetical protein F5141DRAFT_1067222 [Pisolithus sp. B1]|nr:hypothetical protein F5141DRAFT_1067222 [Pisolithus sp. B1]
MLQVGRLREALLVALISEGYLMNETDTYPTTRGAWLDRCPIIVRLGLHPKRRLCQSHRQNGRQNLSQKLHRVAESTDRQIHGGHIGRRTSLVDAGGFGDYYEGHSILIEGAPPAVPLVRGYEAKHRPGSRSGNGGNAAALTATGSPLHYSGASARRYYGTPAGPVLPNCASFGSKRSLTILRILARVMLLASPSPIATEVYVLPSSGRRHDRNSLWTERKQDRGIQANICKMYDVITTTGKCGLNAEPTVITPSLTKGTPLSGATNPTTSELDKWLRTILTGSPLLESQSDDTPDNVMTPTFGRGQRRFLECMSGIWHNKLSEVPDHFGPQP